MKHWEDNETAKTKAVCMNKAEENKSMSIIENEGRQKET